MRIAGGIRPAFEFTGQREADRDTHEHAQPRLLGDQCPDLPFPVQRILGLGRLSHHLDSIGFGKYLGSAEFWERSLQNWQSEFLAVASMAIFAVYLRQRGSPESKPVGAPHDATGIEG